MTSESKPCVQWAIKLAATHLTDLSTSERAKLDTHLLSCQACRIAYRDYHSMSALLRDLPGSNPPLELPPKLLQCWADQRREKELQCITEREVILPPSRREASQVLIAAGADITCAYSITCYLWHIERLASKLEYLDLLLEQIIALALLELVGTVIVEEVTVNIIPTRRCNDIGLNGDCRLLMYCPDVYTEVPSDHTESLSVVKEHISLAILEELPQVTLDEIEVSRFLLEEQRRF